MRLYFLALMVIFIIVLNGCILPFPHFKKTSGPLCGYVVTQDPNVPVVNAHILIDYSDGGSRETETDEQGYFSFPTKMRFHWGVMIGIALNYSLPYDMFIGHYSNLTVDADGLETLHIFPKCYERLHPSALAEPNTIYSDLITCPEIKLNRNLQETEN